MNEVIGKVTESYTDYHCDTSVVENVSNGDFCSKKQDEDTIDDLDSIIHQYNSRVLRSTAV